MTVDQIRVGADWLRLREPADAAARADGLVSVLRDTRPSVIHDLACGSGSMGRWLAPTLPGPQHWVLHDRDPDLLQIAAVDVPRNVTVETRCSDVTMLSEDEFAGADLITASALLDLLTAAELERLVATCAGVGCPVLITLSVVGRVALSPADPLDARIAGAFDDHQRRRDLLGPDAAAVAAGAFRRRGARVLVEPSPWRLAAGHSRLIAEWFHGWVGAACEQDEDLAGAVEGYVGRRLAQAQAGQLSVTVDHADLLVLP